MISRLRDVVGACMVCGLLAACAGVPKIVHDLPELPPELANDLAPARTAPVLITTPAAAAAPVLPRPATPPLPLAPPRACTSVWEGYVTYPITVCYPPTIVFDQLVLAPEPRTPTPRDARGHGVLPVHYFKLTSHPRVAVGLLPWFCSVRGGPWFGHVEGRQICNVDPNIRVFTAQILGAPEPVVVTWTGALTDVPPPLQLVAISPAGEFCVCCSGVTCPDGSCKPSFDLCGTMPPAVK
jgi:hypothetical protein